jgi:anti-sigma regulatory factor (Ser/Thr protein kinase)
VSPWSSGSDSHLPISCRVSVNDTSQVGEARRATADLARQLGFDETGCGKLSLVVVEAASNLIKHAGGGALLLLPVQQGDIRGLDILALDKGPGIADLEKCLRDGFSTAGSPGTGFGAMSRLADRLHIYTMAGAGTALVARLWSSPAQSAAAEFDIGTVQLPMPGETVSGDGWAVEHRAERTTILVVDGLGHGPQAAEVARTAMSVFRANAGLHPAEMMHTLHAGLRSTRGAAVAVAEIERAQEVLRFAGVGNIAGAICSADSSRSMVSYNGTVGHEVRKVQEFTYPFPHGALLVMHSDGLSARWSLDAYAGLAGRDPVLIAAVLYRDFRRERDDATVLVLREHPGGP